MDEQSDTWPPPPTVEVPTPLVHPVHPVSGWDRVCGGCSIIFAMIGMVSLGIAASEVYSLRFDRAVNGIERDRHVLAVSTPVGILLLTSGLITGIMGRRSSQGQTGIAASVILIAFSIMAFLVARVAP